jgi:hydroxymethylbilane synthase
MLPAVGQAALGLECRAGDGAVSAVLHDITDPRTAAEVRAERSCLATLRAGCHAPVGVLVEWPEQSSVLRMEGVVLSPDGRRRITAAFDGDPRAPVEAGRRLAEQLLAHGAADLLTADVAPQSEA